MKTKAPAFACTECGHASAQWVGRCPGCGAWNSLVEEAPTVLPGSVTARGGRAVPLGEIVGLDGQRAASGVGEFDDPLGGGLVRGSVVLLGGEPGVGKSTLLLQVLDAYAGSGRRCLLVSAEESAEQVKLRAARLPGGGAAGGTFVLAETDLDRALAEASELRPDVLVVDSIQSVGLPGLAGGPGSITQVRESAARLVNHAKSTGVSVILVGHVTKDGTLAGPRLLEHMVDVVLYLEGERHHSLRLLRCIKNRFGPTHTVGVFDMRGDGLAEVADASALLLEGRQGGVPGSVVCTALEGRRTVLVELQALVAPTELPQPRRGIAGLDAGRVNLVIAVLERRAGLSFAKRDVFVSVVGGVRVREPAADLPLAIALASSLCDQSLPPGLAAWGEIGLTGELRAVPQADRRRAEAERLGFTTIVAPSNGRPGAANLVEALRQAGVVGPPSASPRA